MLRFRAKYLAILLILGAFSFAIGYVIYANHKMEKLVNSAIEEVRKNIRPGDRFPNSRLLKYMDIYSIKCNKFDSSDVVHSFAVDKIKNLKPD